MEQNVPVSWAQIALVVVGAMWIAAAAFWTWLALKLRRRAESPDRQGLLLLSLGAAAYVVAGAAFVAAGALGSNWLVLVGAIALLIRYVAFRWIARRTTESEA